MNKYYIYNFTILNIIWTIFVSVTGNCILDIYNATHIGIDMMFIHPYK